MKPRIYEQCSDISRSNNETIHSPQVKFFKAVILHIQRLWSSSLTVKIVEALCTHFILVKNSHQCLSIAPEVTRELETNDYESSALDNKLAGPILSGSSSIITTCYNTRIRQ